MAIKSDPASLSGGARAHFVRVCSTIDVSENYQWPSPVSYGLFWSERLPRRDVHWRRLPLESAGVIWLFESGGDKNRFPLQPKTLYGAATLPSAELYY
jgi:hypothetical protein